MVGIVKDVCCACVPLGNMSYYFFSLGILFGEFRVHAGVVTRSVIPKSVRSKHKVVLIRSMTTAVYP
jgi:hypothetical protein